MAGLLQSRRGFTLIEALLACVILSFSTLALATALATGQSLAQEVGVVRLADDLATGLLEEALCLPYDDPDGNSLPGPESGETRRGLFDNLDDFHGFREAPGALMSAAGKALPTDYQIFERLVTVEVSTMQPIGFPAPVSGQLIRVTVRLGGRSVSTLTRFVAQPPP